MKRRESSETRFDKVSCRSESYSRRKRPFNNREKKSRILTLRAWKSKTSGIVRNAFWQSFAPIRAIFDELRKFFHLQSFEINFFRRRKTKRPESSETRFGKVSPIRVMFEQLRKVFPSHPSKWFNSRRPIEVKIFFVMPRTWLGSPRNFAKMRFGRFRMFHFSTPKKNFRRKFRIKILVFHQFGLNFEELRPNGPQNQLPRQILL